MRYAEDVDLGTRDSVILTGTGAVDPATGLPAPSGPVLTQRFANVNWNYVEPQPQGSLTGFEVVMFLGDDPTNTAVYVVQPILCKPQDRSVQVLLNMRSQQTIKAAVRATYSDDGISAWTICSVGAVLIPAIQEYSTNGSQKFADGTIMQWMRTDAIAGQEPVTVSFPIPFPHRCHSVQLTTENMDGDAANDAWFQLRTFTAQGCTIFRQSSNSVSDGKSNKAHIVAWGF